MRILLVILVAALPAIAHAEGPSYAQDVRAVFARAGCNQGTCHGNLTGKGGMKLSLRGENPAFDFLVLTHDLDGRRIDPASPDASLLLLKATGRVPHEGGVRFSPTSREYRILRDWIAAGAPSDVGTRPAVVRLEVEPRELWLTPPTHSATIRAIAVFADGQRRPVNDLAVFESTNPRIEVTRDGVVSSDGPGETTVVVRYLDVQASVPVASLADRPDYKWTGPSPTNYVDDLVFAQLKKLRIDPSPVCTDAEFLRRAYLDVCGILPTPAETRRFLADTAADRRDRLVEALVERPEFADWWALKWADLLRVEEKQLDKKGVKEFQGWIRAAIASGKPLNKMAHELIASRGSTYENPPANYYRALREPNLRGEAFAQVFLGIRMACAKCHNHPFDRWTQTNYHELAAFFARVSYKVGDNKRKDKLDSHEFNGDQIVFLDPALVVKHPVTGAAMSPHYLGGGAKVDDKADPLISLADWVADPKNPFFARAQANRIWAHLVGRGLVDPIDDFRQTNPPANEPLLASLAKDLAEHDFDLRRLVKTIVRSKTYQLSARPTATNADDETHGSHAVVRSLPAEALLDAIAQVTETPLAIAGLEKGKRAVQMASMPSFRRGESAEGAIRFLRVFGKPERLLSCECERSDATTLAQALTLLTGELVNKSLTQSDNRIGRLLGAGASKGEIVDELYLAALCRPPTREERTAFVSRIEAAADPRTACEDVLWAILNSKEFLLRR
jgi:Protein of unknown function (DUF1553)/Protein of unknown function (DUF1549)